MSRASLPRITPAIPTLVKPFHRPGWVYEEKIDGWRMIAYKRGAAVQLVSRTSRDHTARFPDIARAIAKLSPRTLILDGEVAVLTWAPCARLVYALVASALAASGRQALPQAISESASLGTLSSTRPAYLRA